MAQKFLNGILSESNITLDDGAGASPKLILKNSSDETWEIFNGTHGVLNFYEDSDLRLSFAQGGDATFAGTINAPDGSATTPAYNFTSHDGNGMYLEDYDATNNKEQVSWATDGTRRAWVNEPGLWTANNLYFAGQLRKFGEWHATSGTAGEGFKFENTADSTTPLTLTSAGNATFAGDVNALRFDMNPGYAASAEYMSICKAQNQDGGILLKSKPTGGSGRLDWQIINHGTTGNLRFYAYGLAGNSLILDRANGNATFAGKVTTTKLHDYDTIPANQNLLDIGSIKLAGRNDIYGNATKTVITDYVAKYVNDNTGETTIRIYVDDNILVDGDTYMVSVYYENLIGTLSIDFADTAVTGNSTQTGTSSAPKSGRIYGYASVADYTSTYRFVDINLNQGSGHEVTLHSPKVEAGTTLTDFVATERTDMPTNSMHVKELIATSDAIFAGDVTVSGTSSTFNTGNSGTFVTNDTSNYPRLTMTSASAQLGLFRKDNGGMYIGGSADGFRLYTAGFSQKLLVDQSGNATFAGSVTAVGISSTIDSATSGYFATNTAIPTNQIVHVRDNVATVNVSSVGGIKISSSPGNDVFLSKRWDHSGSASFFSLRNNSNTEHLAINMATGNANFAGDITVTGGQVFLTASNYAIENVSGNYGIRNSSGHYGGSDDTNAYYTPQDFFHIPGIVRIGPKFATSDRDYIRFVPAGSTSTIEMPNENSYIHNSIGNIVLRTGSSTDAVIVAGANTTFLGDVTAQGYAIDAATLQTFQDFQSKPIDTNSGLFTVGGHGMQSGYTRAVSMWSSTDGVWNSWVGTNLRWDGSNFKRASDNGSQNWGNIAGIRFLGNSGTSGAAMQFIIDPPEQSNAPSGERTIGTTLPASMTALSLNNDLSATFAGDITSVGLTVDYTGNRTGDAGILVTNDSDDWGIKVDKDGTSDYGILSQTDGENAIVVRNASGTTNIQLQGDGDATFAGTVTATHFYGDGSNLTGVTVSNADTVDNLHAASFIRSDANDTASGVYTLTNSTTSATIQITGQAGASNYNYFLNANNDGGTKAVHFVNGSTRTSDGGANAYVIRNDGGKLILGHASHETNITGSSFTVTPNATFTGNVTCGQIDATSFTDVITNTIMTASGDLDIKTVLTARDIRFRSGSNAVQLRVKGDATGILINDHAGLRGVAATSATATTVVAEVKHALFNAAFFDFVIKNGTNVRAGTVYACHNGASTPLVEFAETSTVDLGDTSDVTLSVVISGNNMNLQAVTTSNTWTIKSLVRTI